MAMLLCLKLRVHRGDRAGDRVRVPRRATAARSVAMELRLQQI